MWYGIYGAQLLTKALHIRLHHTQESLNIQEFFKIIWYVVVSNLIFYQAIWIHYGKGG